MQSQYLEAAKRAFPSWQSVNALLVSDATVLTNAVLLRSHAAERAGGGDHCRADGARLRAISRSPLKKDAPWVVFFAGNGPALLAEARAFTLSLAPTRAVGVVTFAYRGFDGSTGSSSRARR